MQDVTRFFEENDSQNGAKVLATHLWRVSLTIDQVAAELDYPAQPTPDDFQR